MGGGGWGRQLKLQPNFQKKGGLTGPQVLVGGWWEKGGDFFQEGRGLQFLHKRLDVVKDEKP